MPLVTGQDYIVNAIRQCGALRPGYTPQPELLDDALTEWQKLYDSWQAERTIGFSVPDYLYTVNGPGSQSNGNGYLIGPTAKQVGNQNDFQGPRPVSIIRANCVMTNNGPNPVYIPMVPISAEEWSDLAIRQIPAINVTNLFYYDPQFPNGVLNIFPPMQGNSIELFCWSAWAVPTVLTNPYTAPPGYMDAITWSLAQRMWPLVDRSIMPNKLSFEYINGKAYEACQKVRTVNRPIPVLPNNFPGGRKPAGYYDSFVSYTGEPY